MYIFKLEIKTQKTEKCQYINSDYEVKHANLFLSYCFSIISIHSKAQYMRTRTFEQLLGINVYLIYFIDKNIMVLFTNY